MRIVIDTQIMRADARLCAHAGRFRQDEPGTADRTRSQMHHMPIVREAINARILAHWGYRDAIAERHLAQAKRFKEMH